MIFIILCQRQIRVVTLLTHIIIFLVKPAFNLKVNSANCRDIPITLSSLSYITKRTILQSKTYISHFFAVLNSNKNRLMKVLIVDDSKLIQESIKKMIKVLDCVSLIHSASNITDAKLILKKTKDVVVITDIRMPKGNGFELLEYIKMNHKDLKTIMITNYEFPQYKIKALKFGVDHFLNKSNELHRLIPILSSMCEQNAES